MPTSSRRTILYIPGLGDDIIGQRQKKYLNWWGRIHRVEIVFFDPEWHKPESYEEKWSRLVHCIDLLNIHQTTVVGISAGGSLAVRALSTYPGLKKVITVCGKLKGFRSIGKNYLDRTPALYESVQASEGYGSSDGFPAHLMTCYRSLIDPIVPLKDSVIDGAKRKRLPMIGHTPAIVLFLGFYLPRK